jgi:branched-chain amino acid aminotransferase
MVAKTKFIWIDGRFVPWDEAQVHVLTHTLHYGVGVFEGIRCYKRADGRSAIFRLKEHIDRLFESAQIVMMKIPYTREEIRRACIELMRENGMAEGYLRPLAIYGDEAMGLGAVNPVKTIIATWHWGAYLGEEGLKKGIRAKVSSFTRSSVNMAMVKGKIVGQYVNSVLAKREALAAGYDEAIMLDPQGFVSEASGENVFMVKNNMLFTAPYGSPILGGITRDTVIALAREKGFEIYLERFSRDMLYTADECFFTGTAAEITPVREVDNRPIGDGKPGPITQKLQQTFFEVVKGEKVVHPEWLSFIDEK